MTGGTVFLLSGPMAAGKSAGRGTACAALRTDEGFTVVLEDVIAGPLLAETVAVLRGRPLYVVVLLPSTEAIAAREAERSECGYGTWSVEQLHEQFAERTPRLGLWLDTSEQSPEQTVDEILALTT